jgi:hypothetical protein
VFKKTHRIEIRLMKAVTDERHVRAILPRLKWGRGWIEEAGCVKEGTRDTEMLGEEGELGA